MCRTRCLNFFKRKPVELRRLAGLPAAEASEAGVAPGVFGAAVGPRFSSPRLCSGASGEVATGAGCAVAGMATSSEAAAGAACTVAGVDTCLPGLAVRAGCGVVGLSDSTPAC